MVRTAREVERAYSRLIYGLLQEVSEGGIDPRPCRTVVRKEKSMPHDIAAPARERRLTRCVRIRQVDHIHSSFDVELTPERLAVFQEAKALHGQFAFALDRQSIAAVLTDEEKTGQWGRVNAIHRLAAHPPGNIGPLYLPPAVENKNRKPGEMMFEMDRNFWYPDGVDGVNASGYVGHPEKRPMLWTASVLIEKLGQYGCAPTAVIVGELSRFFRDEMQFMLWYKSLKIFGVKLIIEGHGEVTDQNLPLALFGLTVLSQWLLQKKRDAMSAKEGRGEGFYNGLCYGLEWVSREDGSLDKRRIQPRSHEWALWREMIFLAAEGTLRSGLECSAWLREQHRLRGSDPRRSPSSHTFVYNFLKGTIPEGVHFLYTKKGEPCYVKERRANVSDRDISKRGHFRYVIVRRRGVPFIIELAPEQMIPRDILQQARARIIGRKPRRERGAADWRDPVLFPEHMVRCACCGKPIEERPPQHNGRGRHYMEWTEEQDSLLVDLKAQGVPYRDIAMRVAELREQMTGEVFKVTKFQVNKRNYYLGLNGDPAFNRARVHEIHRDPFRRKPHSWHLYCTCEHYRRKQGEVTLEEMRQPTIPSHRITRRGTVSWSVWPKLWEAVCSHAPEPLHDEEEEEPVNPIDAGSLQQTLQELEASIDQVNRDWFSGEFGLKDSQEAKRQRDSLRASLVGEHDRLHREWEAAASAMIRRRQRRSLSSTDFADIQARLRALGLDPRFDNEKKRRLITHIVKEVRVDLEAGTWEVDTVFTYGSLAKLCGQLGLEPDTSNVGSSNPSRQGWYSEISIILRGAILLAAPLPLATFKP